MIIGENARTLLRLRGNRDLTTSSATLSRRAANAMTILYFFTDWSEHSMLSNAIRKYIFVLAQIVVMTYGVVGYV